MAYDATLLPHASHFSTTPPVHEDSGFRRSERLVVVAGATAIGVLAGFGAAMAFGRLDTWLLSIVAAGVFALALYLTAETVQDALRRKAYGCAAASMLHAAALFAWPATFLFFPVGAPQFWLAPVSGLTTLALFASCWSGHQRAVYRISGQGVLVAAAASYQAVLFVMGA
jgi:hypothetical protein